MSAILSEHEIYRACRTLFGAEVDLSRDFLSYLQPSGVKTAYRQKVKETHPDLFAGDAVRQRQQTGLFQELVAAYELFGNFFQQRDRGLWLGGRSSASPRPSPSPPDFSSAGFRGARSAQEGPRAHREARAGTTGQKPHYYGGPLPARTLEFGLFLYYQQLISYRQLIEALIWQRGQRPNLGDIAQRWGWLTELEVRSILAARLQLRRFGEKAVHLQYLSDRQLQTLLYYQRSQQQRLGQFFVEQKILSAEEVNRLVLGQREHNQRIAAELQRARR